MRPHRPVPADFELRWPDLGWSEAPFEYSAHPRTIARWVDECGRDRMILARARRMEAQRRPGRRPIPRQIANLTGAMRGRGVVTATFASSISEKALADGISAEPEK